MARTKTKVCPQCRVKKPRTRKFFAVDKRGVMSWCRACISQRATKWNQEHPDRSAWNHRKHRLKKLYGLTLEEYDARLAAQGGVCAICRRPPQEKKGRFGKLHVDHDHRTGKNRDLLCFTCNAGLGNMRDDPALLRVAADYLDWHRKAEKKSA